MIFNIFKSAICYGLLLNFRSDYLYFIAVLTFIIIWNFGFKKGFLISIFWCFFICLTLTPWAIYSHKSTGEILLTSTNAGHVFYIGLGNLPGNKWGITESDGDERMSDELKKALGEKSYSLNYEGDKYLKKRFIQLISNDPLEYIKKVVHSAFITIFSGIYVPEFHNMRSDCLDNCKSEFVSDVINSPISSLFESREKFFIYILSYISISIGVILLLISYIMLLFVFIKSIKKENIFLFTCCMLMIYQLSINSFSYQMKLYSTNIYIFGLIIIAYQLSKFKSMRKLIS